MTDVEWDIFQAEGAVRELLEVRDFDAFAAFLERLGPTPASPISLEATAKIYPLTNGVGRRWTCGGYLPLASGLYFLWGTSGASLFGAIAAAVAKAERRPSR